MAGRRISPTNPEQYADWQAMQIVSFLLDAEADAIVLNGRDTPATPAARETFGENAMTSEVMHEIAKLIRATVQANKNWRR